MNSHTQQAEECTYQYVDFPEDKSLSIHNLSEVRINCPEGQFSFKAFDPNNIRITKRALQLVKDAHITPLFPVEAFALSYRDRIFRQLTRGNDKGLSVIDPAASTYAHRLSNGNELVVQAETIETNGEFTRQLTISCDEEPMQGEAA